MPDQRKKIIFEGQDVGVQSMLDRLRDSAEELGRDMIKQAREYSTSGKEVVQYLEEQIRAMERRSKLERESGAFEAEKRYATRTGAARTEGEREAAKKEFVQTTAGIKEGTREDQMQVELLRELIETVKYQGKEEIRTNREAVERKLKESERVKKLGIEETYDDELEALKETVQYQQVGEVKTSEKEETQKFKGLGGVERGVAIAGGLAVQPNQFAMVAAAVTMIPIVGQGLGMVAEKLMRSAEQYEGGLESLSRLGGGGLHGYEEMGFGTAKYGVNVQSFLQRSQGVAMARGTMGGVEKATMDQILLSRGLGLGEGEISNAFRVGRGDTRGAGAMEMTQGMIKGLKAGGVMKGGDYTALTEFMQINNTLGQEQISVLGRIDSGINTKLITQLAQTSNIFANPDVLKGLVSAVQSGLTTSKTPQIEALQLATLSRLKPGASLYQLETMMEGGTQTKGYLTGMLGTLKSTSYGNEEFYRNIANTFGISKTMAREMGKGYMGGKLDESKWGRLIDKSTTTSKEDLEVRAAESTGVLSSATAKLDNVFAKTGINMVDAMDRLTGKIEDWISTIMGEKGSTTSREMHSARKSISSGEVYSGGQVIPAEAQEAWKKQAEVMKTLDFSKLQSVNNKVYSGGN